MAREKKSIRAQTQKEEELIHEQRHFKSLILPLFNFRAIPSLVRNFTPAVMSLRFSFPFSANPSSSSLCAEFSGNSKLL